MLAYGRLALLVVAVALLALFQIATSSSRARAQQDDRPAATQPESPAPQPAPTEQPPVEVVPGTPPPAPEQPAPTPAPVFETVRVKPGKALQLRSRPRGKVVSSVGASTEFGSPTVLSVVEKKGNWLGVVSTTQPNNELVWIHEDSAKIDAGRTRWSLHADLSRKSLELRRGKRLVKRIRVAVGRAGSSTPTGRFAVTDKLDIIGGSLAYGCCALALSGHQPRIEPGWRGGNRIAIHGTRLPQTVGRPASFGCMRAYARDARWLIHHVYLGSIVEIRD